jgi:hypothetical protein
VSEALPVSRVARDELQQLDSGMLYITSKRVLLNGRAKNYQLRYSAILGIEVFSDAIRMEKASGRSPMLVLNDPEIPAAILTALLAAQAYSSSSLDNVATRAIKNLCLTTRLRRMPS